MYYGWPHTQLPTTFSSYKLREEVHSNRSRDIETNKQQFLSLQGSKISRIWSLQTLCISCVLACPQLGTCKQLIITGVRPEDEQALASESSCHLSCCSFNICKVQCDSSLRASRQIELAMHRAMSRKQITAIKINTYREIL